MPNAGWTADGSRADCSFMAAHGYVTESMRRWRKWTDGPLIVLAIGSLPILLLELERDGLPPADRAIVDLVNVAVLVAFAVDYAVEFALASDRRSYVRHEWVAALIVISSAVAVLPRLATLGAARALRGVPALRAVLAVARVFAIGGTAAKDGRRLLRRRAVRFAVAVAGFVWVSAAVAFTLAEDVGTEGRIASFQDALWWSAATITTVGYGDITPITVGGRLAGIVAMVVGISTFAVATARVAAFLVVDDES